MDTTIDQHSFETVAKYIAENSPHCKARGYSILYVRNLMEEMAQSMVPKPGNTCGTLGFIIFYTNYGKIVAAISHYFVLV